MLTRESDLLFWLVQPFSDASNQPKPGNFLGCCVVPLLTSLSFGVQTILFGDETDINPEMEDRADGQRFFLSFFIIFLQRALSVVTTSNWTHIADTTLIDPLEEPNKLQSNDHDMLIYRVYLRTYIHTRRPYYISLHSLLVTEDTQHGEIAMMPSMEITQASYRRDADR